MSVERIAREKGGKVLVHAKFFFGEKRVAEKFSAYHIYSNIIGYCNSKVVCKNKGIKRTFFLVREVLAQINAIIFSFTRNTHS